MDVATWYSHAKTCFHTLLPFIIRITRRHCSAHKEEGGPRCSASLSSSGRTCFPPCSTSSGGRRPASPTTGRCPSVCCPRCRNRPAQSGGPASLALELTMGRPLIRLMMTFASLIRRLYARVGPQWLPFSANSFRMFWVWLMGVVEMAGWSGV